MQTLKCYEYDGRTDGTEVSCSEIAERSSNQMDPANIVLGKSSKSASINTAALTTSGKSGKSSVSTFIAASEQAAATEEEEHHRIREHLD